MSEQPNDNTAPKPRKGKLRINTADAAIEEIPEQMTEWLRDLAAAPEPQEEAPLEQDQQGYMDGLRVALADRVVQMVNSERQGAYGPPEDGMTVISRLWSAYLEQDLMPSDVVALLALLKVARLQVNPFHLDSWLDLTGYGLIGSSFAAMTEEVPE
jgi:hypothetical protein